MAKTSANSISVLIVADPGELYDQLVKMLKAASDILIVGAVTNPADGLARAMSAQPDIVLVDDHVAGDNTLTLIRDLGEGAPASPTIIMAPHADVNLARQAMLAGARGFLLKPFSEADLLNTMYQIYDLELARRTRLATTASPVSVGPRPGQIIALYSPKGGAGCTTLAVNLAIALKRLDWNKCGASVVLVDGNLQFGDVGVMLNIPVTTTIAELLPHALELDSDLVDDVLASHTSGISVLLAPPRAEAAEAVTPEQLSAILAKLREMFDYVVVDTWSVLEEKVLTILAAADRLLLVSTPEVTALHGAKRFLELIDSLGYTPHKVLFVLNRAASKGGIDLQIIEEHIKEKLNLTVPNDWALASYAANRGVPLLISHPKSAIARSVVKLAQAVASDEHLVGSGQTSGLLSGLRLPLTVGQRE